MEFNYFLPVNIVFGSGKVLETGELTKPYGKKALIVTGKSSAKKSGLYDKVNDSLKAAGLETALFDKVSQNPLTTTAQEGADFAKANGCDVVVAIGGGSIMDCAKAIAFLSKNDGDINDYIYNRLRSDDALPLVLIPTTCGTGSEGNGFAVLTNPDNGDKKSLRCNAIVAKVSIVDPECMMTMPKRVLASVTFDALCHTEEEAQRVKFYATQAREPFPWYQHEQIGYNYRLSNVSAGIGRGQMRVVDNHIAHRRAIHRLYTELLAGLPGITVVEPKKSTMFLPNYWLTTIKVDSNETSFSALQLMQHLAKADIETRPLWKPLHLQPVFSSSPTYVNGVSEALFNCGLCLPSGSMMTCEDVMRVADAIRSMR